MHGRKLVAQVAADGYGESILSPFMWGGRPGCANGSLYSTGTISYIGAYLNGPSATRKDREFMHSSRTARTVRLLSSTLLIASCVSACTLPTNVAIKQLDTLRAEQTTCLVKNAQQMDDRTSDPNAIARDIAIACSEATERLVTHAIAKPNPEERRAFQEEAELRAAGYVKLARSGSL